MENSQTNPYLDRLLRHMAWANGVFLSQLADFPTEVWKLELPNEDGEEGSVGEIARHFTRSSAFYTFRLTGSSSKNTYDVPTDREGMLLLAKNCAETDAHLRELSQRPDEVISYVREGETHIRARSTILGQSIHHATEHRAQIASIITAHGVGKIDLDALDVWSYSDAEGLGN